MSTPSGGAQEILERRCRSIVVAILRGGPRDIAHATAVVSAATDEVDVIELFSAIFHQLSFTLQSVRILRDSIYEGPQQYSLAQHRD